MKQDDIIRMAREAGMAGMLTDVVTTFNELARFAALVEAAATEAANARANASWTLMCKKMVAAELNEIATVFEDNHEVVKHRNNYWLHAANYVRSRVQTSD
jgi:hypothetical protein